MRSLLRLALLAFAIHPSAVPAQNDAPDASATVRLNQIQVIGTHNSYHAGIAPGEIKVWQANYADAYKGLEYSHPPLAQQLDRGVRQIELDVFADSKGGRYAHPSGPSMAAAAGLPPDPDFDPAGLMSKPGFKVMHVQDVDYRSTCQPFIACLQQVRDWSHAHSAHIPIFLLVETKQDSPKKIKLTEPEPFSAETFDALDAEIRSVFPASELITPDDVRGTSATLEQSVLAGNWPTLASARGKVIFLMDQRSVGPVYLADHQSLKGRVLFTNAEPGEPDAAFIERNEGSAADINALVRKGYLIRARTDGDTRQARLNDTSRRDEVMASGAQMLSTDYPNGEPARWPGAYIVTFPDKLDARCNPINKPPGCDSTRIGQPLP